ncbi:MAG: hypothetical protein ACI89W_000712, partial [Gammaproteobacteria bacterium]
LSRKQLIKRTSLNDQSLLLDLRKKKQPSLKLDCRSPVIRAKRCRGVIHLAVAIQFIGNTIPLRGFVIQINKREVNEQYHVT